MNDRHQALAKKAEQALTHASMTLIDIHWGWITPGVGQSNRRRQLDAYMEILEARQERGEHFLFTQPGWVLDTGQPESVRSLTSESPETGKNDGPMTTAQLMRFQSAVARGQLTYVAYPYSGAVVEGMTGEAVLRALRLSRAIAEEHFGVAPDGFFVHDGPFQLDWNTPMIPQIGRLAGFTYLLGSSLAIIESSDGSRLPMLGQPQEGSNLLCTGTEAPDLHVHMGMLQARFGDLSTATSEELRELLAGEDLPVVSAQANRTKGWYGGAPAVMQQQAFLRQTDVWLTTIAFNQALRGETVDLTDNWKASLVLQDCHLQWLLADVERYYTKCASDRLSQLKYQAGVRPGAEVKSPRFALNMLPHRRSGVLQIASQRYGFCRDVDPGGSALIDTSETTVVRATPTSLENNRIRVELGPCGEIQAVTRTDGQPLFRGTANRLRHWVNRPAEGDFMLRQMSVWDAPFSGNIELETEVEVLADGTWRLCLDVVRGLAVAVTPDDGDWVPVTNRHWGGGLPSGNQEHVYSQTCELKLTAGHHRLKLHAVADEGFKLRDATLHCDGKITHMPYWRGRKVLEWAEDPLVIDSVTADEQGARAEVRFRGRFATCEAEVTVALEHDSERLQINLNLIHAEPTYEGLQTLPLPAHIGSYLGSYCERPYVPAFTVEHQTPRLTSAYTSDKPYGYAPAEDSDHAWSTGRFRELFEGMAPFLGIFTGIAEGTGASLAMLTDGHGHFFRRRSRHDAWEWLGLSLGSSIIHPMTQSYRMPASSEWQRIGRSSEGVDYDDAHDTFDFVRTRINGCDYSLLFSADDQLDRQSVYQQQLEQLVPLVPASECQAPSFELIGERVVLAALERRGDVLTARLLNLSDEPRDFRLRLPAPIASAEAVVLPVPELCGDGCTVIGRLPPLALRELTLSLTTNPYPPPHTRRTAHAIANP